jgi:hypothetical protein
MRRAAVLAFVLLAATSPGGFGRSLPVPPMPPRARSAALPLPPLPPARAPQRLAALHPLPASLHLAGPALQPAPLPDPDKTAPPRVRLPVEMAPTLYWPRPDVAGDGYLPGSQHLTQIELPGSAPAGLKFTIPLD